MLSFTRSFSSWSSFYCWASWVPFFTPPMASPKLTSLFLSNRKQTKSVRCVSLETLTSVWIEDSNDRDFAKEYVAPPELDRANPNHSISTLSLGSGGCIGSSVSMKHLLVLICSAEDYFGDGQFDGCLPYSGTVQHHDLLRSRSCRPTPTSPTR